MKIQFDEIREQTGKTTDRAAISYGQMQTGADSVKDTGRSGAGFSVDLSGKAAAIGAYGRQKRDFDDALKEAAMTDAEKLSDQMLVCASTMSKEDYKKMVEEGVRPGQTEVGDALTIMDHIKTVMARSGTVVDGFNGAGDMDMDMLTELTGSPVAAMQIAEAFAARDLPATRENVEDVLVQEERAADLTVMTDGMKQYTLENNLQPTLENLYLARFSAGGGKTAGGGYFADDLAGYIGKSGDHSGIGQMTEQLDKVISEAGMEINEESRELCTFLMDSDIPLTAGNLLSLRNLESIRLPLDRGQLLSCMTDAISEGKRARDANLAGDSLREKAVRIKETVDGISDEAVREVVEKGEPFTIRSLSAAQREIRLKGTPIPAAKDGQPQDTLLSAQRTLAEVRLQMTVSANMQLLRSDYSIDTTELATLAEDLRLAEESARRTWNLSLPDSSQNTLFAETMTEREEMFAMPAAVLGRIADSADKLSLHRVHEEGRILQETYTRAGESYEALMTSPRADLGDRLKDAFSNIDELLSEQKLAANDENRRAVRILAYNRMEITASNIASVKAADVTVTGLLEKMNPAATLQMIRDGINPLEGTIEELNDYFDKKDRSPEIRSEKFSRFLYKLEQTDGITAEERETYMGIYRLLHQIEKGDGKAIGTVVNNGQELTLANLLSAVRTSEKGGIEQSIDDDFGGISSKMKTKSISEQINTYYQRKAGALLGELSPMQMKADGIGMASVLDELFEAQVIEETRTAEELEKEELTQLRQAWNASGEVTELLAENGIAINGDNLMAAADMQKDRGSAFRQIKKIAEKMEKASGDGNREKDVEGDLMQAIDELLESPLERFTDAVSAGEAYEAFADGIGMLMEEQMYEGGAAYLDIRSLSLCTRQLSVMRQMSRNENYELPAVIDGELTDVNVHFTHDQSHTSSARIRIELTDGRQIHAGFYMKEDRLQGIVGTSEETLGRQVEAKMSEFKEKFLAETGKDADISIVYSESFIEASMASTSESPKEMYQASRLFIRSLERL